MLQEMCAFENRGSSRIIVGLIEDKDMIGQRHAEPSD